MANELDDWVRRWLAPGVRRHGFTGGPRRFRRASPGFVAGIQVQGSLANQSGSMRFTINYGVWHEALGTMSGVGPDAWHVDRRIGWTRERDTWWWVGGAAGQGATTEVPSLIETEVMPFLDAVATPEGFAALIDTWPEPGRTAMRELLDRAAGYDAASDTRTRAERMRDAVLSHPLAAEALRDEPGALETVDGWFRDRVD